MQLSFTPKAARQIRAVLDQKGDNLALRIAIRRRLTGTEWSMTLEPRTPEVLIINGLPVLIDDQTAAHLDGLIIDWVQTPQGPGFGVYDRNVQSRDLKLGAD